MSESDFLSPSQKTQQYKLPHGMLDDFDDDDDEDDDDEDESDVSPRVSTNSGPSVCSKRILSMAGRGGRS